MWKGWISLFLGLWLILSGTFPDLQINSSLIMVGAVLTLIGFIKLKTWHGMALSFVGFGILSAVLIANVTSGGFFIGSGVVIIYLGVRILKVNMPDYSKAAK